MSERQRDFATSVSDLKFGGEQLPIEHSNSSLRLGDSGVRHPLVGVGVLRFTLMQVGELRAIDAE